MVRAGEYTNEMVENKGINVNVSKKIKTMERKTRKNRPTGSAVWAANDLTGRI